MKKFSIIRVFFFIFFLSFATLGNYTFGAQTNINKALYQSEKKANPNDLYKTEIQTKDYLYIDTPKIPNKEDKYGKIFNYISRELTNNINKKTTFINTINNVKTNYKLNQNKSDLVESIYQYIKGFPNYHLDLKMEDKKNISKYIYQEINNYFDKNSDNDKIRLGIDFDYQKIYVTILVDNKIRCCRSGKDKNDLNKYIKEATIGCIEDNRFGGKLKESEINNIEITVSILFNKQRIGNKSINSYKNAIEPGIHGLEIQNGSKNGFFKETVQISKNYYTEYALSRLCKKIGLNTDCYKNHDTNLSIYDTYSFKSNQEYNIIDLYRYNTYIPLYEINQAYIQNSIELAQQRFLNSINKDSGLLEYIYYPSKDKYESQENNHIRQLASLRIMTEIDNFLKTKKFETLTQDSLDYYLQFLNDKDGVFYFDIDKATIANNAFTIMILLNCDIYDIEYPDGENKDSLLNKLGKGLIERQQENGSFKTKYNSDSISGIDFYPGESLLALMKLYNYNKNEIYLETVKKAFPYYSQYWRGHKTTAFIPWQTQSNYLLYLITKNEDIKEFIFEMNDRIIDRYQIDKSEQIDKIGGFPKSSPRSSTSSYLEGIADAYLLAKLTNDKEHTEKYENSLKYGTRFILQTQFKKENTFYLENPNKAIGGFKASLINNELRNDYTQHASAALMKIYNNEIFK